MNPADGFGATICSDIRGIKVTASFEVEGDTVTVTSAAFGTASAKLEGSAPEQVAERLLRDLAEVAIVLERAWGAVAAAQLVPQAQEAIRFRGKRQRPGAG